MRRIALVASLTACACTTQSDDDAAESASTIRTTASTTASTAPSTEATTTTVATAGDDANGQVLCGEFGAERLPTLIAIDIATGALEWRECPELSTFITPWILQRAGAATLLFDQDGMGGESIRAVDADGVERWQRPTRMGVMPLWVAGDTALVAGADVEAIDAATGEVMWFHPVAEGTPVGTTDSIVVEGVDGPVAPNASPGSSGSEATLRALDVQTGEELWTRDVELVPTPPPGPQSPSVVGSTVIVPLRDGTTDILDVETGDLLRNERLPEFMLPNGSVLVAMAPPANKPSEIIDPRSGSRYPPPPGVMVYTVGQPALAAGAGMLMSSDPPVGPQAKLWLLDELTGTERWSIPFQPVIGRSHEHLVVADGPIVRVLSIADGTEVSTFELPTERARLTAAAVGDDQVVLVVEPFGGAQGDPVPIEPVDCSGGTTLLETVIVDAAVTIVESPDGSSFCITSPAGTSVGRVPTAPTAEPVFEQSGLIGPAGGGWYTIALPEGFADDVTAIDQSVGELITARGSAADYLVLIQPHVGQTDNHPAMMEKSVDIVGADGTVLARITFTGFATEDVAPIEEVTFEEFITCLNANGVAAELPTVSGPMPPPADPVTPEQMTAAWTACRDVWAGAQRYQDQGHSPEFVEQRLFLDDCLAEVGFFPMIGQPLAVDGYGIAYDACSKQSPGRVALAECLEQEGLDRADDGQVRGGPYPPELASAAWQACRPVVVSWLYPPMTAPPEFFAAFDCAAELGWIIPAIGESPNPPQLPSDVRSACAP